MRRALCLACLLAWGCDDGASAPPDQGAAPADPVDAEAPDQSMATTQFEQGAALCGNGEDDDGDGLADCDDPGCSASAACAVVEPPPPPPPFLGEARAVDEQGLEVRGTCAPEGEGPYPCWALDALPDGCTYPRFYEVDRDGTEHVLCVEPDGTLYQRRPAGADWITQVIEGRVLGFGIVDAINGEPRAVACGAPPGASVRLDPFVWLLSWEQVGVQRPVVYEDNAAPAGVFGCAVADGPDGPVILWTLSVREQTWLVSSRSHGFAAWTMAAVTEPVDVQGLRPLAVNDAGFTTVAVTGTGTCGVPCTAQSDEAIRWSLQGMVPASDLPLSGSAEGHVWPVDRAGDTGALATLYGAFIEDGRTLFGYATAAGLDGRWARREVVCGDDFQAVPVAAPDVEAVDGRVLVPWGADVEGGLRVLDLETLTFTRNDVLGAAPMQVEAFPDGRIGAVVQFRDGTWGLAHSTGCE